MVLSDVNENDGQNPSAERWLRQRSDQRSSAVRCIFGPPDKRQLRIMMMINEADLERKRMEFMARFEPVDVTASERREFYDGLIKTPSQDSQRHHESHDGHQNGDQASASIVDTDDNQRQQQNFGNGIRNSDDD